LGQDAIEVDFKGDGVYQTGIVTRKIGLLEMLEDLNIFPKAVKISNTEILSYCVMVGRYINSQGEFGDHTMNGLMDQQLRNLVEQSVVFENFIPFIVSSVLVCWKIHR